MRVQPYDESELQFAFCNRIYLRWCTYRARRCAALLELDAAVLTDLSKPYGIHILDCQTDECNVLVLASLAPTETVSACASKLKGKTSQWLHGKLAGAQKKKRFSRSYFATTIGKSTSAQIQQYLDRQGQHHGYSSADSESLFVRDYALLESDAALLNSAHAATLLRYHIVLATSGRRPIFRRAAAERLSQHWEAVLRDARAALLKISFVPDHVHLAIRFHPAVRPSTLVAHLMNSGQQLMFEQFSNTVMQACTERLWQPSAYVGSFGDLTSAQIRRYIRDWKEGQ
jgi:REP element-mobilizing transposase RayT